MLEFEIAAIYYFIASILEGAEPYFEEIPEDMLTPCVFYPTPELTGGDFSTGTFQTDFVMYIKFMDATTSEACMMASNVMREIMKIRNKIPLVDASGNPTGKHFRVNNPVTRKVDNGVYQMEVSWRRYTAYTVKAATLAQEFFFNGNPVGSE